MLPRYGQRSIQKRFLEILCDLPQKLKIELNEGTTSSTCKTQSNMPDITSY